MPPDRSGPLCAAEHDGEDEEGDEDLHGRAGQFPINRAMPPGMLLR